MTLGIKKMIKRLFTNFKKKYKFVVMDESFHEKFSFRLSRVNVFVVLGVLSIVLVVGTMVLIAFTPLRQFIPGYIRDDVVEMSYLNKRKLDSLEKLISVQDDYLIAMNMLIMGEQPLAKIADITDSLKDYAAITYSRSAADDKLRAQVEQGNFYDKLNDDMLSEQSTQKNLSISSSNNKKMFYTPLQGSVLTEFNSAIKHYGIDIIANKNDDVRAIANGTVLSAEWTPTSSYSITIQHSDNMISVYKHASSILKNVGDVVKTGEAIAFIGNGGENYKGPMLHFELWYNGNPVNPNDYIPF
jgi:murein DD-endopeptidase MepM/ murein hydrolase activator NlpD